MNPLKYRILFILFAIIITFSLFTLLCGLITNKFIYITVSFMMLFPSLFGLTLLIKSKHNLIYVNTLLNRRRQNLRSLL